MADTGTTRSFGNMLNQKPVSKTPGKAPPKKKKGLKSPWSLMKKLGA